METPTNSTTDSIMTDSSTPNTANPTPNPAIVTTVSTESILVNGTTPTSNLPVTTTQLVAEAEKVVLANAANGIAQDLTLSDIAHVSALSAADLLPPQDPSLIEQGPGHVITAAAPPSIPTVDLTPLPTAPAGFGVPILPGLDIPVNAAHDEFIVMDNGLITGACNCIEQ